MQRVFRGFLMLGLLFCGTICGTIWINPAHAQTSLDTLLQDMARHSAAANTLRADFVQEKRVSFLQTPLRSSGHFFFTKNFHNSPALLWEYLTPAPSGILFQKHQGWMWLEHRAKLKKAHGPEGAVLSTMIEHMLQYFVFEPHKLHENYHISIVTATQNTGAQDISPQDTNEPCLKLVPRDTHFFTSMNMCIDKKDFTITALQFHEKTGDSITLRFANIGINTPYPTAFPDGTPFP